MENMYSFAAQWLKNQDYEIYIGNKRILDYDKDIYPIHTPKLKIKTGFTSSDAVIKRISDYESLRRMGFIITSLRVPDGKATYFSEQKVMYQIKRIESGYNDYGFIPKNHKIEFDAVNKKLRLIGKNAGPFGIGYWIFMDIKRRMPEGFRPNLKNIYKRSSILKPWLPKRQMEQLREIEIPNTEIPIMISEGNELICMPLLDDEPVCGIVGMRSSGKTWFSNGMYGRMFWNWHKRIGIINDKLAETGPWCLPWDAGSSGSSKYILELSKLNEKTMPLPAIYLHPNTNNLKRLMHGDESSFKMSWNFKDIIENYQEYFGNKKDWKLEKSGKYFRHLKDSLIDCKTIDDVKDVIDKGIPEDQKLVKQRLNFVCGDLFNQQILDVQTGIPSSWTLMNKDTKERKEYKPFTAALIANLVPILVTNNFSIKDYFPEYFKYIVNDVFNKATEDEFFVRNKVRIMLGCDEITDISSKKKQTAATEILDQVAAEGRQLRIGLTWITQNPELISERITSNTDYQFSFRFNKTKQANAVIGGFHLAPRFKSEILSLKSFEFLACTTKHFISYDLATGTREKIVGEGIKGFTLPPLNQHKAPKME